MRRISTFGTALSVGILAGAAHAGDGPDSLVGSIQGSTIFAIGETIAVSSSVTLCNVGNEELEIIANTPAHPITVQNFYRVDEDGLTQLGVSWVSHRFCALQQNVCGTCTPANGGCAPALGVGCSDVTSASLEGSQFGLSSRFTVNPSTGVFMYPFPPTTGDSLFKRLQYEALQAMPTVNPEARYFMEAITIAPDDDASGNDGNNASYREATTGPDGRVVGFTGTTERGLPAVFAWQAVDPSVRIEFVDIPGDGRVYVASRARDNGDGTFTYTYCVSNLNSHEAVRAITVPIGPGGASVPSFTDIHYHSGDTQVGTDWPAAISADAIEWAAETISDNADANAVRWGTSYRFSFVSTDPPTDGTLTLGTFRNELSVPIGAAVPAGELAFCPGDCDGSRAVDFGDLVCMLGRFGEIPTDFPVPEDCDNTATVDFNDLVCALGRFGDCE